MSAGAKKVGNPLSYELDNTAKSVSVCCK